MDGNNTQPMNNMNGMNGMNDDPNRNMPTNNNIQANNMASTGNGLSTDMTGGMNNSMPSTNNVNFKKKSNTTIILMSVLCVICLAVGIVGVVFALNNNSGSGSQSSSSSDNNSSSSESTTVASSGTKVELSGFELTMPDDYRYEISTQGSYRVLSYTDDQSDYLIQTMYNSDVTFSTLKNNFNNAVSQIINEGVVVKDKNIATVGGVEYAYFVSNSDTAANIIYAFSEANLNLFVTIVANYGGLSNTEYLEKVSTVLGTAKKANNVNRDMVEDNTNVMTIENKFIDLLSK